MVVINGNLNARRDRDEVIHSVVIPHVQANRGMIFMHDNRAKQPAQPHPSWHQPGTGVEMAFKTPDLNPIGTCWTGAFASTQFNGTSMTLRRI